MARNSSGVYALPVGNPVVANTTIDPVWANNTLTDIGTELTSSLDRSGRGGMLAALRGIDGVVGAPLYSFTSETSTGMWRSAAGTLNTSILGVTVAILKAQGLLIGTATVGIGASASTALSLGNGTVTALASLKATGGEELVLGTAAGATYAGAYSNNIFSLRTNNTDRVLIDTSGNVGIGMTAVQFVDASKSQNTTSAFQITNVNVGVGAAAGFIAKSLVNTAQWLVTGANYTALPLAGAQGSLLINDGTGGIAICASNAAGTIRFAPGGTTALAMLDATGQLGLGRTPSYRLDSLSASTGAKLFRFSASGGADLFGYSDASGSGITNTDPYTGGAMVYLTSTVANVLAPGGMGLFGAANSAITNIGANITVLDIVGKSTTRGGGINLRSSDNSLSGYWYVADGTGAIGTRSASTFALVTSDTARMTFAAASGDITAQGVAITRVKTALTARASTTVLADDPHLVVPLSVGTWAISAYVPVYATASGAGGFKAGLAFSGTTTTAYSGSTGLGNGAATTNQAVPFGTAAATFASTTTNASAMEWALIQGSAVVTVAGNLSVQWAQNSSNVNNTNVPIGAWVTCTKVG